MTQDIDFCRIPGDRLKLWRMIDDACEGEQAIKKGDERYLPKPNPQDVSPENDERYKQYKARAVFYNATGRTLSGLVGVAFSKDAATELSTRLEYLRANADGAGNGLEQLAQKALNHTAGKGRAGILVDYPATDGNLSRSEAAGIGASMLLYRPQQIINWDTETVNGQKRLNLVVLKESGTQREKGGFKHVEYIRWRVLALEDGVYIVRIFEKTQHGIQETANFMPSDAAGNVWHEIPFTFTGSNDNDPDIDQAPLADLASLNVAHYRNSADVEESSYIAGQPTLVLPGLKQQWYDHNLKGKVYIGCRGGLPLNEGADAKLLQASPNQLPFELMKHKEEQMIRIGARLLEPSRNITATGTKSNDKSAYSVLSLCVANVSSAITKALQWCAAYMGDTGESWYEISRDFVIAELTAQDLLALVQLWQSGTTPRSAIWALLRRYEIIDPELTDEEIEAELANEPVPLMA
ncbi:DUF4055 domain-containing protein [Kistimonas scapharcae]|uniref:DUF4055 domain-containing protein n=1 Tax=Kistimonas scapharcae TaxID=1036133 RepID=A0ABP8V8E3_9GAMM